jgi:hypothetical protein
MITCGIASIPSREKDLKHIIDIIRPQVDFIWISLNGYNNYPPFPREYYDIDSKCQFTLRDDPNKGDAHKFDAVDWVEGYFLALDDDLIPPKDYVDNILEGVDKYNGLVSYHGRMYLSPVQNFKQWAGNYRCLGDVSDDVHTNFIGSGCCAFHTDRLKLSLEDFKKPNMADVYLSRQATLQGVPMMVLKHNSNLFEYTNPIDTIWKRTHDYTEHLKLLQSFIK